MLFAVYKGKKYQVISERPNQTHIISPTPAPGLELVEGGFGSKKLTMYERVCTDDELDNLYSEKFELLYHGVYYPVFARVIAKENVLNFLLTSYDYEDVEKNGFEIREPLLYEKSVPESEVNAAKIIRTPYPTERFKDYPVEEEIIDQKDLRQWILDNPLSVDVYYLD